MLNKRVDTIYHHIQFWTSQRIKGYEISTTPDFGCDTATNWFKDKLLKSSLYIEWGSGSSTYFAAKSNKSFISIDSDKYFLKSVKKRISNDGLLKEPEQKYLFSSIGPTYKWGFPVLVKKISKRRLSQFRKYSDFPLDQKPCSVLFVLVDGRFRVACALKALRELSSHNSFTLVIDDYIDRPYYKIIEQFAVLEKMVGRMAVFNELKSYDLNIFNEMVSKYETDFR